MSVAVTGPLMTRRDWAALLTIGFGVSLVIMDATIVNVALPVVIEDLSLTATEAQWMNAVYSLVFASLLITVGRVGDLKGRRLLFLIGMVVFMASSVVAGLSVNGEMLILARFSQGIGAAMILPSTLSSLNALFTGRARVIAFAVYGSAIGGMAAIGPLLGGWLATDYSWRWAFWLNIPVGLLVVLGIVRALPETRDPAATPSRDALGVALTMVGMGAIVFALIEAETYGWWRTDGGGLSPVPFVLAGGVAAMVWFVVHERRRAAAGRPVLVDLGLFAIATFSAGVVAALIVAFGEFGLLFTLPLLLQGTLGYTALQTGWVIVALAAGTFLISGMLPRISRFVPQRTVVQVGLGLEAIAVGALALAISMDVATWQLCACLFVYGVGVGMATAQLTSLLLHDVPVEESGQASGLQSSVRQLGSALGVAVLGGILIGSLGRNTEANLAALALPATVVDQVTTAVSASAGTAIAGLQAQPAAAAIAEAAGDAMITASRLTTGLASLALVVGLLATFRLPRSALPTEPEPGAGDGRYAGPRTVDPDGA
ncbi:MAG TPA: MFS transporter [Ornithinibacter sp.]|nr:MFS transporter [Ornithinibacter sp.]